MEGDRSEINKTGRPGEFKVPLRTWIIWLSIFGGIILLMLFKDGMDQPAEIITQHRFEELLDSSQIVQATVSYDNQSPLNRVVGTYDPKEGDRTVRIPFRATVRLTPQLEQKMFSLPQFQPRQPNTLLTNVLVSVLPIVLIAVLICFFFIRQIRKVSVGSRTFEQQAHFDRILDKWEQQASRMDGLLDKLEKNSTRGD